MPSCEIYAKLPFYPRWHKDSLYYHIMAKMKDIISKAVKESASRGAKPSRKKIYTLTGAKKTEASSALKVLGALNALEHTLHSITSHARKVMLFQRHSRMAGRRCQRWSGTKRIYRHDRRCKSAYRSNEKNMQ